jgi:tetratricopeptide (TPR) repeat protein
MADVFISYDHGADHAIAEKIAIGLEASGLSVWYDQHIQAGVRFNQEIDRQLAAARAVIVLWSAASKDSDWVHDEAQLARDANKLIPVRIDSTLPPLGFRQVQSLDIRDWNGDPAADSFEGLLAALRRLSGHATETSERAPRRASHGVPRKAKKHWLIASAAVATVGVALLLVMQPRLSTRHLSGTGDDRIEIGVFEAVTKTEDLEHFGKRVADSVIRVLVTNDVKAVARVEAHSEGAARTTAEFTLRGNVDREGANYVVSADLLHNREGLVLWSTTMQRNAAEPQLLELRFSTSIAKVMRCALALRRVAKDDASVDLVGNLFQWCAAGDDGRLEQLPVIAQKVVEAAPSDTLSYSLRAYSNAIVSTTTAVYFTDRTAEERARLRTLTYDSAKTALEMDSNGLTAGGAYFARAVVIDPAVGLVEREQLFQKALSLAPQVWPYYYYYAKFLGDVGRIEDARNYLMRGLSVEPLRFDPLASDAAYLAAALGELSAARDQFKEVKAKGAYASDSDVPSWFDMESDYGDPAIAKQMLANNKQLGRNLVDPTQDASNCLNAFLDFRSGHVQLTEHQVKAACSSGFFGPPAVVIGSFGLVDWEFREFETDWGSRDFYALYPGLATQYFLPNLRSVRADPRFMRFAEKIGRVDYWLDSGHWPDYCRTDTLPYDCKEAALAARASNRPAKAQSASGRPS